MNNQEIIGVIIGTITAVILQWAAKKWPPTPPEPRRRKKKQNHKYSDYE